VLVALLLLFGTYPSFYNYSFDQYFQISYMKVTIWRKQAIYYKGHLFKSNNFYQDVRLPSID
jgi:hypothetical protein